LRSCSTKRRMTRPVAQRSDSAIVLGETPRVPNERNHPSYSTKDGFPCDCESKFLWNTGGRWQAAACHQPRRQQPTDLSGAIDLVANVIHLRVDGGSQRRNCGDCYHSNQHQKQRVLYQACAFFVPNQPIPNLDHQPDPFKNNHPATQKETGLQSKSMNQSSACREDVSPASTAERKQVMQRSCQNEWEGSL